MEEDWEKTLILAVTFLLVGGFVISPKIKMISLTHYFALFLILFMSGALNTKQFLELQAFLNKVARPRPNNIDNTILPRELFIISLILRLIILYYIIIYY